MDSRKSLYGLTSSAFPSASKLIVNKTIYYSFSHLRVIIDFHRLNISLESGVKSLILVAPIKLLSIICSLIFVSIRLLVIKSIRTLLPFATLFRLCHIL